MSVNHLDGLCLTSIGGMGMFGMNCLSVKDRNTHIVVDCGIMFPDDDHFGVDLVTPDFTFLEENLPGALFVTHGHEDHIGGIPHLLRALIKKNPDIKLPVYGSDFTNALIARRLAEYDYDNLMSYVDFITIRAGDVVVCNDIRVEIINVSHSIPGSYAFALDTSAGKIVHTGDWRIDDTPVAGHKTNLKRFEELGDEGVRVLLSDSTNVEIEKLANSESDVFDELVKCFKEIPGRIFITLFASNISRLQSILDATRQSNRSISVCGRSLNANLALAREQSYLRFPEDLRIVREENIEKENDDKTVIVIAGSQGEKSSALFRISMNMHPYIKLRESDVLVYSARQIPGNEKRVDTILNNFYKHGAGVIDSTNFKIHSSGHGGRRELQLLLELIDPDVFVPVHGDYRRLKMHEELANTCFRDDLSVALSEGKSLFITKDGYEVKDSFPPGRRYVVGKLSDGMTRTVMRDKKQMAHHGVVIVSLTRQHGKISSPMIDFLGIAAEGDWMQSCRTEIEILALKNEKDNNLSDILHAKTPKIVKNKIGKYPFAVIHVIEL